MSWNTNHEENNSKRMFGVVVCIQLEIKKSTADLEILELRVQLPVKYWQWTNLVSISFELATAGSLNLENSRRVHVHTQPIQWMHIWPFWLFFLIYFSRVKATPLTVTPYKSSEEFLWSASRTKIYRNEYIQCR